MTRILMIVYGITAEQAAARAPAAQFAVTSVIAALFVWLDSMGIPRHAGPAVCSGSQPCG